MHVDMVACERLFIDALFILLCSEFFVLLQDPQYPVQSRYPVSRTLYRAGIRYRVQGSTGTGTGILSGCSVSLSLNSLTHDL